MDDPAKSKVEPSRGERQENREREMAGFSTGLITVAVIVAVVIVVVALILI